MNFMYRQRWTVSFLAEDCRTTLRGYSQLPDETTLRRLVREGFCEDSDDFERQVRAWGQGSTWLQLTEQQYRTLTRPRHARRSGRSIKSGDGRNDGYRRSRVHTRRLKRTPARRKLDHEHSEDARKSAGHMSLLHNATSQDRGPSRLVKKVFNGLHEFVRLFYERKMSALFKHHEASLRSESFVLERDAWI